MKKIVILLLISCICLYLYANNIMINKDEYLLYENKSYLNGTLVFYDKDNLPQTQ